MKECPRCRRCYEDKSNFCPIDGAALTYGIVGSILLGGKYKLERLIARGGMGAIYQAVQQGLEREVAIKVLNPELINNQGVLERFRREALAVASMKHPNIVTIYDFGVTANGSPYIVMEYLKGRALSEEIERHGKLSVERTLAIVESVCSALSEAHSKGIVHRDLKPDNIMVENCGGEREVVKVVDFGLAKLRQSAEQRRITGNLVIGTFDYMSPEQCQGFEVDARADIYSLGVVMYEMLTGKVPFEGASRLATIYKHINEDPRPLRELAPEVPQGVERVVMRALAKAREDRQSTARELVEELRLAVSKQSETKVSFVKTKANNDVVAGLALKKHLVYEHFVGREREIAQLTAEFAFIRSGKTRPIIILGDPGIGKTQLVNQFWHRQNAIAAGTAILISGRFFDYLGTSPYKTILDCLTPKLQTYSQDLELFKAIFGEIAEKISYDLEHDWPFRNSTKVDSGALRLGLEGEKYRIFEYLSQIYIRLARHVPMVFWMDDIQWADGLSLNFLAYLLRRSLGEPIQFIFCGRLQDVSQKNHPVQQWQNLVSQSRNIQQIRLSGLAIHEIEQYIALVFDDIEIAGDEADRRKLLELLWNETQGNPYYLAEILRLLVEEGKIFWNGQRWVFEQLDSVGLPTSILNIVDAHLRRFSQEEMEVFMQAAVLGEQFSFELLRLVCGMSEDKLIDILEAGLAGYVFREGPVESPYAEGSLTCREEIYSFYQAIVRKVLYSKINTRRRRKLHLLVAEVLESNSQASAALLAYHYLKAEQYEQAFRYSVEAAGSAWASFAVEQTEKHLRNVEQIFTKLPKLREIETAEHLHSFPTVLMMALIEYYVLSGEFLITKGRLQDAEKALSLGLRLSEKVAEAGIRGRAMVAIGQLCCERGRYEEGLKSFEAALRVYQQVGYKAGQCQAMNRMGWAYYMMAEYDRAAAQGEQCVYLASQINDKLGVAAGRLVTTLADYRRGRYGAAMEGAREVYRVAQEAGDRMLECQSSGLLGTCYAAVCSYVEASKWLQEALQASRDIGTTRVEASLMIELGKVHLAQREYQEAIELFSRAYEIARSVAAMREQKMALLHLGLVYKGLGYKDQAFSYLRQSSALKDSDIVLSIDEGKALGEVYLSRGEVDEAVAVGEKLLRLVRSKGLRGEEWAVQYLLGRALRDKGDLEGAERELEGTIRVLRSIAADINDANLRRAFLKDKTAVVEGLNQLRGKRGFK
ncbi:MAG: protein kinase [Acidobacteriota bacterium]|nr:protein kinase [Blastocatellia bacterium]MDW8413578.1 protein kinase [Acidobacteriota bacterium]